MKITIPRPIQTDTRIYGVGIRQFIYLGVGLALGLMIAVLIPTHSGVVRMLVGLFFVLVAVALAFMKVNGHYVDNHLINFLRYVKSPRTRVWNKEDDQVQIVYDAVEFSTPPPKPKVIAFEFRKEESIPASLVVAAVNIIIILSLGAVYYYMMYAGGFHDIQYWLNRGH